MKNYMYKFQCVNTIITYCVIHTVKVHLKQLSQRMSVSLPLCMQIYKSYALVETNQNMIVPFIPVRTW